MMNLKLLKYILCQLKKGDYKGVWYTMARRKYLQVDINNYQVSVYGSLFSGFRVCESHLKMDSDPIVYSFGIGEDLSFSEALMDKISPQIFAYDPTPRAIAYVKNHALFKNEKFHFFPYGLSDKDEVTDFFLPIDEKVDVSGSAIHCHHLKEESIEVKMRCMNSIIQENGHNHIDLLKMDIEGSEFDVIDGLRECVVPIYQICLEIHDRFFDDGLDKLRKSIATLREMHYLLISVSYSEQELTFIRENDTER